MNQTLTHNFYGGSKKTAHDFLKDVEDVAILPILQQHSLGATQRSTFRETVSKIKMEYTELFDPSTMPSQGYSHFKEYKSRKATIPASPNPFHSRSKSVAISGVKNVPSAITLKTLNYSRQLSPALNVTNAYKKGRAAAKQRPESRDSLVGLGQLLREKVSTLNKIPIGNKDGESELQPSLYLQSRSGRHNIDIEAVTTLDDADQNHQTQSWYPNQTQSINFNQTQAESFMHQINGQTLTLQTPEESSRGSFLPRLSKSCTNKAQAELLMRRKKMQKFINKEYAVQKERNKILQMAAVDINKIQEQQSQMTIARNRGQRKKIEKNQELWNTVIENDPDRQKKEEQNKDDPMEIERKKKAKLKAAKTIALSKDSINNHIGNVGQFIARHVEDAEANGGRDWAAESDLRNKLAVQNRNSQLLQTPNSKRKHVSKMNSSLSRASRASRNALSRKSSHQVSKKESKQMVAAQSSHVMVKDDNEDQNERQESQLEEDDTCSIQSPVIDIQVESGNQGIKKINTYRERLLADQRLKAMLEHTQTYTSKFTATEQSSKSDEEFGEQPVFLGEHAHFKSGITPPGSVKSEMARDDKEQLYAMRDSQVSLHRQAAFDETRIRKSKFKQLMNTTAIIRTDQSEIHSAESVASRTSKFPFKKKGQGLGVKQYEQVTLEAKLREEEERKRERDIEKHKLEMEKTKGVGSLEAPSEAGGETQEEEEGEQDDTKPAELEEAIGESVHRADDEAAREAKSKQSKIETFLSYLEMEKHPENIAQVQQKLEEYILKEGLNDYKSIKDPQFKEFAKEVSQSRNFMELCKNAYTPKVIEQHPDPRLSFFKSCQKSNLLPLNILQKISDKSLHLKGYKLNIDICKAIREAMRLFPELVDSITLENNGIKDEIDVTGFIENSISVLLQASLYQSHLKKFVCINNALTQKCFYQLTKVLERKGPNNLQELRLSNCKLSRNISEGILETLKEECQLKKLGLINANLRNQFHDNGNGKRTGGTCLDSLKYLIENSNHLTELDLSWNDLQPIAVLQLTDSLVNNRKLQYLNLSWNNLRKVTEKQLNLLLYNQKEKEAEIKDEKANKQHPLKQKPIVLTPNDKKLMQNVTNFIKYNFKLLHFDLSNTGLSKAMLEQFGPALRKSRSLLSLHLSGNPGIDLELKQWLSTRVHCRPGMPDFINIEFDAVQQKNWQKVQQGETIRHQLKEGVKVRQFQEQMRHVEKAQLSGTVGDVEPGLFTHSIKREEEIHRCCPKGHEMNQQSTTASIICDRCKQNIKEDNYYHCPIDEENYHSHCALLQDAYENNILVFDRILGHKSDMPGVGQWRQIVNQKERCWVRAGYVFTLIFWNKHIGYKKAGSIDTMTKEILIQKLEELQREFQNASDKGIYQNQEHPLQYNLDLGRLKSSPELPVIQGPFNNWYPQQMMKIQDYCDLIDENQPNFIEQLIKQGKIKNKSTRRLNELTDAEMDDYDQMHAEFKRQYTKTWRYVINTNCRIKSPAMANYDTLEKLQPTMQRNALEHQIDDQLFVFPCYVKPGKNYYMVRLEQPADPEFSARESQELGSAEEEVQPEYFAHSMIAPFRTEEIPGFVKSSTVQKTETSFNKNNSVFQEWKQDTAPKLEEAMQHDFASWKVQKLVKDPEELQKCQQLIQRDYAALKLIHTYYASLAPYPYMNVDVGFKFIKDFQIMDKNLTQEVVTPTYTGSQVTSKKIPGTQDGHLLRFQFIEWLVRLANGKYKEPKRVSLHSDALRMFLDKDITPHSQQIIAEWDGFRTSKLWTSEVNDIFKANLTTIKLLMKKFMEPRKDKLSLHNCINIFTSLTATLPESTVIHIFGLSKMSNIHETKDFRKYKQVNNLAEFLELIGRAAEAKYKDDVDSSLSEKIVNMMNALFALVDAKVNMPVAVEVGDESQSDADY